MLGEWMCYAAFEENPVPDEVFKRIVYLLELIASQWAYTWEGTQFSNCDLVSILSVGAYEWTYNT